MSPRPDGKPTIRELLLAGRSDKCEVCGGPMPPVPDDVDSYADMATVYDDVCSDKCHRIAAGKTWAPDEDCPACPSHKDGPHKFGCAIGGARQIKLPVTLK